MRGFFASLFTTTTTTIYVDFYTVASYLGTSGAVYRVIGS